MVELAGGAILERVNPAKLGQPIILRHQRTAHQREGVVDETSARPATWAPARTVIVISV
jgi:hypothetical protein